MLNYSLQICGSCLLMASNAARAQKDGLGATLPAQVVYFAAL